MRDVEFELILAVVLVVLVIFLFLRTWRATIIPSLSVPLSLVGTFGAMYLLGYSLNNLSLMALTIATGFVVDDAIVMIENIARYIEEGDSPMRAALKGAEQIGFTIVSLTVSLIAVLIPLLFMGDVVGRLFREFAVTLAVTILISAGVSLTLVPMLCARILRRTNAATEGAFERRNRETFDWLMRGYDRSLTWVLDRQALFLLVAVVTLALTVVLYIYIPKGFFPVQDTGFIQAITEASQSISFQAMSERQQAMADVILQDPAVDSISSYIGVDGTNVTLNSGRILINLKDPSDRDDVSTVIRRIERSAANVSGISLYMQPVQDLTIDATVSRTQYRFILEDANPTELTQWVPKLVSADVGDARIPGCRQRPAAERALGLYPDRSRYRRPFRHHAGDDRQCTLRFVRPAHRLDHLHPEQSIPGDPRDRSVLAEQSQFAWRDLSAVIGREQRTGAALGRSRSVRIDTAPLQINHLGQFPANTVSFNLAPGVSLGAAVTAVKQAEQQIGTAGEHGDLVPGRGLGLPGGAQQRSLPHHRRDHHRLYRPRRSL